jgi:acyl-CoA reductase-like NAD-dependent aldehyde dehydrogenase
MPTVLPPTRPYAAEPAPVHNEDPVTDRPAPHPFALDRRVTSFIAGCSLAADRPGHEIPVVDPTTEDTISVLREADAAEVDAAVQAARHAFDQGPWPRMDIDARKDILYSIRDHLRRHADELAWLECRNAGLPMQRVRSHIERMARNFEFFAEIASGASGESYSQTPGRLTVVTREPKGVAACIAPWNAPLALASMRVATCIPWGNTCVLKPSEHAPLSVRRLVEILHEAGLPPGVVNLVNGRGSVTGEALVAHPGVDMVGFTGGTQTGRRIAETAGRGLKPVTLELGGKSANIVFDTADVARALDGALAGIYSNNGQQCLAGSRILLQRGIADAFIERFVARSRRIRIGDPLRPDTELGPLAFSAHLAHVLSYVDIARADGATLLTGGRRAEAPSQGFFMEPTAVLAPDNGARVCRDEIFGPFATFLVFDTVDEAIAIANDSRFALAAYVWSEDLHTVMRCSRDIRAGTVWVNTPMLRELRAPFGGGKDSGIGRDGPRSSLEFFTEPKSTIIPIDEAKMHRFGA